MEFKDTLLNLMGLPADASDEVIQNSVATFQKEMVTYKEGADSEISKLTNAAAEAIADKDAAVEKANALLNSNKALTTALVEHDLDKFSAVIANRDEMREVLLNNRDSGLKILNGIKVQEVKPAAPAKPAPAAPLHNYNKAAVPAPIVNGGGKPGETQEKAIKVSNRASQLRATTKGLSYHQAFLNARAEVEADEQLIAN